MLKNKLSTLPHEVGCDEAGRGCLSGPVVAAGVLLPENFQHQILNDSKQLNEKKRLEAREIIEEKALAWSVKMIFPEKIDEINILNASILAMQQCVAEINENMGVDFIAIDGNRFKPVKGIPHQCVIKGDAQYLHIAAASILAKTYRDDYMKKLSLDFPAYHWDKNKGYPTKKHREAIANFGPTIHHRKSFRLLPEEPQLYLKFEQLSNS